MLIFITATQSRRCFWPRRQLYCLHCRPCVSHSLDLNFFTPFWIWSHSQSLVTYWASNLVFSSSSHLYSLPQPSVTKRACRFLPVLLFLFIVGIPSFTRPWGLSEDFSGLWIFLRTLFSKVVIIFILLFHYLKLKHIRPLTK